MSAQHNDQMPVDLSEARRLVTQQRARIAELEAALADRPTWETVKEREADIRALQSQVAALAARQPSDIEGIAKAMAKHAGWDGWERAWTMTYTPNGNRPEEGREYWRKLARIATQARALLAQRGAQPGAVDRGAAGIEVAARFIEQKAQDYVNEHASNERDTGAVVWHYGNAGLEYHSTLVELADEIRSLKGKPATSPPAGEARDAAWPEEPTDAMQAAGAQAIRFDTTLLNKLWTANAVYRAMRAAMHQEKQG